MFVLYCVITKIVEKLKKRGEEKEGRQGGETDGKTANLCGYS